MTYPLKVYSQRDSSSSALRAKGCGPYSMVAGIDWATEGGIKPDSDAEAKQMAADIVNDSGISDADWARRGLSSREMETAAGKRTKCGYPPLKFQRRSGVHIRSVLIPDMIEHDRGAWIAVNYGVVVDAGEGVGTYRKGHWVFVFQPDPATDTIRVLDPIRRARTTWKISTLVKAAERFGDKPWGNGRGEVIVCYRWRSYKTLLTTARAERDAARKRVKELEAMGTDIAAARAGGIRDAAAAAAAVK